MNLRRRNFGAIAAKQLNTLQIEQMVKRRARPRISGRPGSKVADKQVNQFENRSLAPTLTDYFNCDPSGCGG